MIRQHYHMFITFQEQGSERREGRYNSSPATMQSSLFSVLNISNKHFCCLAKSQIQLKTQFVQKEMLVSEQIFSQNNVKITKQLLLTTTHWQFENRCYTTINKRIFFIIITIPLSSLWGNSYSPTRGRLACF